MRSLILLTTVIAGGFFVASCGCEPYVANYSFDDATIYILDKLDYNEDSTETIETEWRQCDSLALGSEIKVGVNFVYVFSHDLDNATCDPEYVEFRDSIINVDIVAVYPLEGIEAGQSVMEEGGWTPAMKDSLLEFVNTPLWPAYGAIYLTLDNKPLEEKVQFKVIVDKAKREDFEVLTNEVI
ncbi:MAG: hypothetical protein ACPGLV_06165 [Bacteroidia bacterium]